MATLAELARAHTKLGDDAIDHLQRLIRGWGMLADLCFGDLVLLAEATDDDFVVLGQMRPSTSQTLHHDDLVGRKIPEADRPVVARAFRSGEIVEGEVGLGELADRVRMQGIPVRRDGNVIAVMTREAPLSATRRPGALERVYGDTFERFARMIVRGEYPFAAEDDVGEGTPRVGDGAIVLDASGRIEYASPNAVNALHRMGIHANVTGSRLDDVGVEETAVSRAFFAGKPVTEEVERPPDVVVQLRCLPLLHRGDVTGGLVLLRDVTDIRRRDRLLLSKDESIREIHHRVKNNLQTISSLLRLQARRLPSPDGKAALKEAERRIRSIARVHEVLSMDPGDQVAFGDVVRDLVRMAEESVVGGRHVEFRIEGDAGELHAEVATPLAVVISELLQNASEHAFPEDSGDDDAYGLVTLTLHNDGHDLDVEVRDNGEGLPEGFSPESTDSLGLSIVTNLVTSQLKGTIDIRSDHGTVVELRIPLLNTR
ncbi:MAG TPA: histidine kinase N-terminal domain-containing protein [Acidimicrobiales bacterium]|nr:histidine kinase N-terminal domain-containing protein [Acidimicrobiales bacterium]